MIDRAIPILLVVLCTPFYFIAVVGAWALAIDLGITMLGLR